MSPRPLGAPVPRHESGRHLGDALQSTRSLRIADLLIRLKRPAPIAALVFGCLLLLSCNLNAVVGHRAVMFKHYYPHAFMLFVVMAVSCKIYVASRETKIEIVKEAVRALPWFLLFGALVGVSVLVSNGTDYQEMASDYWDADPLGSTSRRIGLPVLANVLGFARNGYIFFWYAVLFAGFCLALRYLGRRQLSAIERMSVLSSSIFAYSLVGPGYNEIFVFLLGLYALQFRLTLTEKVVVAGLMIATHETATAFLAMAVILDSDDEARAEWMAILGIFYAAYVAAYIFNWRGDVLNALMRAGKPSPGASDNSLDLVRQHPFAATLGVALAYKLYWLPVVGALRRRETRAMAGAVLISLVLVFIGTDTSRLVQFSSLGFLIAMGSVLPTWPNASRTAFAAANLLVPSLYVATNAEPLWGTGLYSLYLYGAQAAGLEWGRLFVQ